MNIIAHVLTLFIFTLTILILNLPKIQNNNIYVKMYIFLSIFVGECFVLFLTQMFSRQVINLNVIVKKSIYVALIAVVAYSIYNDLFDYKYSFSHNDNVELINNIKITICITFSIFMGIIIDSIVSKISPTANDCLNNLYFNKK